ncbi:MAG TPA: hypothetical protein VKV03_15935 [Candidatus Binataceae bacterium]|nr:hypothetical protein [Candidatus Binataceae bacterium]
MTKRMILRLLVGCATLALAFMIGAAAHAQSADDDWQEVSHTVINRATPQGPAASASQGQQLALTHTSTGATAGVFKACGELARPAQEPYKSIIAQLNQMWGTRAKVYESVVPMSPHASKGGCIFYNAEFQEMLTSRWMGITDEDQLRPMLYAINAHELGHIMHGDLTAARARVPLQTKELEADRFAGYTLWRLNVKRFDATDTERYYQAVGDDYVGAHSSHGTGAQRTTAFQEGWDLARTGAREDSARPAGGLDSAPIADVGE